MPKLLDLAGKTFGELTVLEFAGRDSRGRNFLWACRCSCGKELNVRTDALTRGAKSCGHLNEGNKTHGMTHEPEFRVYIAAKQRCTNPNHQKWKDYGARGIQFRFNSFEEFFAEVGKRPSSEHSIDRINNDGHYEVGNVKWSTLSEQNSNRRTYRRRRKINE